VKFAENVTFSANVKELAMIILVIGWEKGGWRGYRLCNFAAQEILGSE
jgi:hypothetical protein